MNPKICQVTNSSNYRCVQKTDIAACVCLSSRKKGKKREGSQVSVWIHENTCFSSPSVIHLGLTPHLVPISIALVALPRVKAQTHSCTKDRDLWHCDCQPWGSKPELTWRTGPYTVGISEGRHQLFCRLQLPPAQHYVLHWSQRTSD